MAIKEKINNIIDRRIGVNGFETINNFSKK